MFTMPIFPRYKEEKRTIITSITQYVMFRIMIPGSYAVGFSALPNGVELANLVPQSNNPVALSLA